MRLKKQTSIKKIHRQQIDYVNNSGVTVEVVEIYGHVTIADGEGNEIFLQGDEGSDFIGRARCVWNRRGNITRAEASAITAYPYVDTLVTP